MGSTSSQDEARDGQAIGRTEMAHFPGAATPARPRGQHLLGKVAPNTCQPGQVGKHLLFKRGRISLEHGARAPVTYWTNIRAAHRHVLPFIFAARQDPVLPRSSQVYAATLKNGYK